MKPWLWAAWASGPLALGLWWLASLSPATVESVYSRVVYPALAGPWSRFWALFPFAVGPWLLATLAFGLVALFFLVPPVRALSLLAAFLSVLLAWFVLGWGLNYQRQSWAQAHARPAVGGTVADLEALAGRLAAEANRWQSRVDRSSGTDWATAVNRAYRQAADSEPLLGGSWGVPKPFPIPELLSWAGIAGIYLPFTAEPLYNPGPADWQLPFTLAHEAAHLRGWAREDEANFLAFWVLRRQEPALAYSAWSSALLYVASALEAAGPAGSAAWGRVVVGLDAAVREDWSRSFAYWDRFKGPVRVAAQAVNDAYLKTQGQSDGVKSYGRMVDLLLAWQSDF